MSDGEHIQLGKHTRATPFDVTHVPGAAGWKIESGDVTFVFSGDTEFSDNLVEFAKGANLLIHEVGGVSKSRGGVTPSGHSTSEDAGRAASLAGVSELIMTHIPDPYHFENQPLIDEASKYFDGPVSVVNDLDRVTVGIYRRGAEHSR